MPYFFHRPDDELFWFAGLAVPGADGEPTVAINTTDANVTASAIHGRMPVMLPDDDAAAAWIEPEADRDALAAPLKPPAAESVTIYPVSRWVKKSGKR